MNKYQFILRWGASALFLCSIDMFAQSYQGPVAEKRLAPIEVESGQRAEVNIIVKGYSIPSSTVVPFDMVIVIDQSSSMSGNDPHNKRVLAAQDFVSHASSGIRIGVVAFSDESHIISPLTNDFASLGTAIGDLADHEEGLTNLRAGMAAAQAMLIGSSQTASRYVILLTDGYPEPDYQQQVDAIQLTLVPEAIRNSIAYYTVGLNSCDIALLRPISSSTGGMFAYASSADALQGIFDQIFQSTAYQYVAGRVVLKERVSPQLTIMPGSFSMSPGDIGPSENDIAQFYSTRSIDIQIGQLASGFERSFSFNVSAPGCLSPDSPNDRIKIAVDDAGSILQYIIGSTLGSVPVQQESLTCLRPGAFSVEKRFNPSLNKVTIKLTNNYLPNPTHDNTIRKIKLVEPPSIFFEPIIGSVSTVGPASKFLFFPSDTKDYLVWEIASLAPQDSFKALFDIRCRACQPGDHNPLRVDAAKNTERADPTVEYGLPDDTRGWQFVPQLFAVLPQIDLCDGRPDFFLNPAYSMSEYEHPVENSYAYVSLKDETESVWIDGAYNGYVQSWNDAAQIQARLTGATGSGSALRVKGQGDEFHRGQPNKLYFRIVNTGNKANAPIGSGLVVEARRQLTSPPAPSDENQWDLIAQADVPAIHESPIDNVVLISVDLPANTIRPSNLEDYGLSLRQLLEYLQEHNQPLFSELASFLSIHQGVRTSLAALGPVLPSQVFSTISGSTLTHLRTYFESNPAFHDAWARKAAKLRIGVRGADIDKHTNNSETTEMIIVK